MFMYLQRILEELEKQEEPGCNELMYDLIFNIFLRLKCFRSDKRRNNSLHTLAERHKGSPIMFTGNHFMYKSSIMNDM